MKQVVFFLVIVTLVVCMGCGESGANKSETDCPIPPPKAIFKNDLVGISEHTFERSGRNSEESMVFADSTAVTIFQSGCDKVSQEFRFTFATSPDHISKTDLAVEKLAYMARLGPDYLTFDNWAQAIEGLQEEFRLENTVEVEPGFYVSIDKLESSAKTILLIKLFQK